jgi:hypothetical protein
VLFTLLPAFERGGREGATPALTRSLQRKQAGGGKNRQCQNDIVEQNERGLRIKMKEHEGKRWRSMKEKI